MTALFRLCVCTFLLAVGLAAPAAAEGERIALIIGNSEYRNGYLKNPVNDADLVGEKLESVGFQVTVATDADERGMERAIVDFSVALSDAGRDAIGLFYFAGHGIQDGGENYLIPIGARIERRADLGAEAVRANWVLEQLRNAGNRVNFVILDACRNNPLPTSIFRSSGTGLAEMTASVGTFIGYSTAPGQTASDGEGEHSVYAAALADIIERPGLPAELVFKRVRDRVMQASSGFQVPWDTSSLAGEDFFFVASETVRERGADGSETITEREVAIGGQPMDARIELAFWDAIKTSDDPADFAAYLERFPNGNFAVIARNRLSSVDPGNAALSGPSLPADIIVDVSGGGDYASIQDAIELAKDGEVIHVRPGVYEEDVTFSEDKDLVLIGLGAGEERAIIKGDEFRPLFIYDGTPRIENFVITNDKPDFAAVWITAGGPKLTGNTVRTTGNSCIYVQQTAIPVMRDNQIGPCAAQGIVIDGGPQGEDEETQYETGGSYQDNTISGIGDNGLWILGRAAPSIVNNRVENTGADVEGAERDGWGAAAYIEGEAKPTLVNNTFARTRGAAVITRNSSAPELTRNTFQTGAEGMGVYDESSPVVSANTFDGGLRGVVVYDNATGRYEDNSVTGTEEQAILALGGAPVVVGNTLSDVPSHCLHVKYDARGEWRDNRLINCGLPPSYAAIHIDEEATPVVTGNVLEGAGQPTIVSTNPDVDVSDNTVPG
ncbi:MAG: pectinesterase family protein [Caulobacterales bacterium]|nr:pectinesterase family protein [Caulobacterales bacterium]